MTNEEMEDLIESLRGKLDDESNALISDELITIKTSHSKMNTNIETLDNTISKLNNDKDELLRVNGNLFRKLGFDKEEKEEKEENEENETYDIEDIINEKGELI